MQQTSAGTNLNEIDPQMTALLHRKEEQPVFLHPTWLRTWLAEFGAECEPLVLATSDGALHGVAPLMRTDDRITFIGDSSICDFMDFLVDPQHTDEAYASLWSRLAAEEWTELYLWGLMAGSPTREAITTLAQEAGCKVEEQVEAVSPRLTLPGTWDDYLASLGKKDRHELRRKIRRLFDSGAGVSFDVYSTQAEIVAAMDDFLDLHTRSRQDKTDFMTDDMAMFFRRMASAMSADGLIKLFFLRINNRPAASVLCFDAGSYLYMYNSGYDPEFSSLAVGLVSKALVMQWAIENGKKGIDFLRGNEPYKYDLGARDQEVFTLQVRRSS